MADLGTAAAHLRDHGGADWLLTPSDQERIADLLETIAEHDDGPCTHVTDCVDLIAVTAGVVAAAVLAAEELNDVG